MRVLVCGGRNYGRVSTLFGALSDIQDRFGRIIVIQGGAMGADYLARRWAQERDVELVTELPDWETHGKAAGPIRNQKMLVEHKPDLVLAFHGGRGTADMVRRAKAAGVEVMEIE